MAKAKLHVLMVSFVENDPFLSSGQNIMALSCILTCLELVISPSYHMHCLYTFLLESITNKYESKNTEFYKNLYVEMGRLGRSVVWVYR